jgi:hypothetical protein
MRSLRWEGVEAKNLGIGADPGDREHCWPHRGVKRSEDQLCRNAPRPVRPRWAARLANRGRESAKHVVSGTANHQERFNRSSHLARLGAESDQQIPKPVVAPSPAQGWALFALRAATGDAAPTTDLMTSGPARLLFSV